MPSFQGWHCAVQWAGAQIAVLGRVRERLQDTGASLLALMPVPYAYEHLRCPIRSSGSKPQTRLSI